MNKEIIEQRKDELKKQLDQVLANANALHGAIQECEYWLSVLNAPQDQIEKQNTEQREEGNNG
jgi:hypothetical protein